MTLCEYRNIFGKPNEGLHSYRLIDLAIVDVIATVVVAYLISIYGNFKFFNVLVVLFLLGITMHYLFCVDTTINIFLFGPHNIN
jgi:hypothetical protein